MLQVAFSFQNSVKVTYVRHFFNFKCVLQMLIQTMISFFQRAYRANMWYPDHQNKKLNLYMLNSFKGFHLCIK